MITPFDSKDRVDLEAVERNVTRWRKTCLQSFLVGSVSGEELFLSEDEKLRIASTVRRVLDQTNSSDASASLMGGIDCPSVSETLRRADAFAEAGADLLRIRIPRYEATVIDYFSQVLARSPLPVLIMHQSAPDRFGEAGGPAASPQTIGAIAAMENVFGYVTDHDMRFETQVRWYVPQNRRFWICNGSMMLQGTLLGCNGTTTAFANIWPDGLEQLLRWGMAGEYEKAAELQRHIQRIDTIMLPYRAAGIKAAMQLLGFEGSQPRVPTPPMPPAEAERLADAMRAAGLIERSA